MGVANDKKVVRDTAKALLTAISNLLESQRERKHVYTGRSKPLPRRLFCGRNHLEESIVAHIETGRMLNLSLSKIRLYLAVVRKKDDQKFNESFKRVYDGLGAIDDVLRSI